MDRIKILFQTDPTKQFNCTNATHLAKQIYARSGIKSFWRGHTATLVRVVPYSATNYFIYDRAHEWLNHSVGDVVHPTGVRFAAGAASGSAAVCVTYPLENLRARLAVDLEARYSRGYIEAVRNIARSDGFLSLYSGLRPTLAGIIPYAGTSFAVYETLKSEEANYGRRLLIGAIAGFIAQATTYPLDVIRRRMQVRPLENTSVASTFMKIVKNEGMIRGLYKGLSMNAIKGPIAVAISLSTNDHLKHLFLHRHSG
jgi:solute carrier family 25 protein 42